MKSFARICVPALLLGLGAPAFGQPLPQADPEVDQMICQLGGCDDQAAPAASAPAGAEGTTPRGTPRAGPNRGFTFKREAPAASAAQPSGRASASTAPRSPGRATGSADLRLSFATGSSTLDEAGKARLRKLAAALASPALAGRRARIEGHTDSVGSVQSNRELSQRRAQSAADFLVSEGIEAERLEVVGYGSSRPLPGTSPRAAQNRRVMAVIVR